MTSAPSQAHSSELITAGWVVPIEGEPIRDGGVVVADGKIVAVDHRHELEAEHTSSYENAVLIPGFVNAHSHLEYASFAGFGDGLEFGQWLELHMRRKRQIGPLELQASARLGASSCLASGITSTMDASFAGVAATACAELGLGGIVCPEVFGADPDAARQRFDELRHSFDKACETIAASSSPPLRLGISPHAPYTVGADVYRWAQQLDLPATTHLAESAHEREFMLSGSGPIEQVAAMCNVDSPSTTSVKHLHDEGLLGDHMTAAHCVTVDEDDVELLAQSDTSVAHCPRSNAQLGCGSAPLAELLDAGVRVGIGTDSPASAPDFDMFAELRATIATARTRQGAATAIDARQALELATLGSARAVGLADQVGSLREGKRADLAIVSLADSPYDPIEEPETAVVYGGSPHRILRTITSGVTRYGRGEFEWHELREAARAARARMLEASVTAAT